MAERRYFPISLDQLYIVNWADVAPASMMNLAVRIDIDNELDEELFRKAFILTVERLPYARIRLHDEADGTTVQYISEMNEQSFPEWTDCGKWTEKKLSSELSRWAGTAFPNKLREVQLFRAELLKTAEGKHCFYFCGHHIIMDIQAVIYLITYVDSVYDALIHGNELPKEGASPEKIVIDRNKYIGSSRRAKDEAFWREIYTSEPQFTSINGLGGSEFVRGKRYGHGLSLLQMASAEKSLGIPKKTEELVKKYGEEKNISPSTIYCFAVRCYLAWACKTEDVSITLPTSMRSTLGEKSCGITMSGGGGILRTVMSGETSFAEGVYESEIQNRDRLKHIHYENNVKLRAEIFGLPKGCDYYSVMFSYVPFVDFSQIHLKVKATKIDSGIAIAPVYILVMHQEQGGELDFIYQYSKGYVKEKNIDKCHAFVLHFLEEGLNHPEKTIRELSEEEMR